MRRIRAFFCCPVLYEPGEPVVAPAESTNRARLTKCLRIKGIVKCDRQRVFDLIANFLVRNVARSVSESSRAFPGDPMLESLDSGDAHAQIRVGDTCLIRDDPQIRACRGGVARGGRRERGNGHTSARRARQHRDCLRPVKPGYSSAPER